MSAINYPTNVVMNRLGLTRRQLKYLTELTVLPPYDARKRQLRWSSQTVRQLEVAVSLNRLVPAAHPRQSSLPAIFTSVQAAGVPPTVGWVVYDGTIRYLPLGRMEDSIGDGGLVARIPDPWELADEDAEPDQPNQGWAVVEER